MVFLSVGVSYEISAHSFNAGAPLHGEIYPQLAHPVPAQRVFDAINSTHLALVY
jgi:hypothetical protein